MTAPIADGDLPTLLVESAELMDVRRYRSELNRAITAKDSGDPDTAAAILEGLLSDDPDSIELLGQLSWVRYLQGRTAQSADLARRLLKHRPLDVSAMRTLGLSLRRSGKEREARKWLKRTLDIDPNDTLAHIEMMRSFSAHGDEDRAIRHATEALRIDPSLRSIRRDVAELHDKAGHKAKAVAAYERVTRLYPDDRKVRARLARLKRELPRQETAPLSVSPDGPLYAPTHARPERAIRIGLATRVRAVEFSFSGQLRVVRPGRPDGPLRHADTRYRVTAAGEGRLLVESLSQDSPSQDWVLAPARLESVQRAGTFTIYGIEAGGGDYWAKREDRSYRGSLELIAAPDGSLTVVNSVDLESYLYGVVPSEMSPLWPDEALKAQAIAARSEALGKLGRHAADGYDLCAETHCQVYSGTGRETSKVCDLVDRTAGRVLMYEGRPVDAVYSSSCGGHTQDNIFGEGRPVPYLRGTPDGGELLSYPLSPFELDGWLKSEPPGMHCGAPIQAQPSRFRWVRTYTAAEMDGLARRVSRIGAVQRIEVLERGRSGHAKRVRVVGAEGEFEIEKELAIRRILGDLRSALFKVETRRGADGRPEEFLFFGGGWGHAVGMCQSGAAGRALAGQSAEEILAHYYPGAELRAA